ncbi:mannose/fructose/sorbose-specific PTS system IIB component [Secundilactobacillus pentosiphilus]|uniref:Mannose/fructose/sorbose-specific PTS system IIB component n=1 Tax=Secundilactobacillus pentosiphilus TaxID=1714682 RepID=A0A1Z5IPB2_9LACO|nr:PTS sugar transporter subunit IIB [Secundilactobacillus pentosiphilus]GAX03271.1 mannose/fructose/sorbose-specific PTS system IIB component [Secundilactobacillus pentosiphilus]
MTMDIQLARIGSRLLPSQVAREWVKATMPNRILVVSNRVAQDHLRQTLILQSAPRGIEANVLTIKKMLAVYQDPEFDAYKPLLLTETAKDMAKLVKGGVDLQKVGINLGILAFQDGMKMLTDGVAVDKSEAKALSYLTDVANLKVVIQEKPTDKPKDIKPFLDQLTF